MTPICVGVVWQGQHGTSLVADSISLSAGDIVLVRLAQADPPLHRRFLLWRLWSGRLSALAIHGYTHSSMDQRLYSQQYGSKA